MFKIASIFIVEDEISILKMYKILLKLKGYSIHGTALNGEEAISKYKSFSEKPDIIIMDYRMPIKDGLEASKEILEYDENAKIIFASADYSIVDHAKKIGALSFKIKPFNYQKLLRNIEKALKMADPPLPI